jgi:hypothetical protein
MGLIEVKKPSNSDERLKKQKKRILNSNCIRMTIPTPVHIHKKFKSVTCLQGKRMTEVVLDMIMKYIDKNDEDMRK